MTTNYAMQWNLNSLFEKTNVTLAMRVATCKELLDQLESHFDSLQDSILALQEAEMHIQEMESLVACLMAQDVSDLSAIELSSQVATLKSIMENFSNQLSVRLADLSPENFETLIKSPALNALAFTLEERRFWSKEKLSLAQERLMTELSVNGYQGWSQLYETMMGHLSILDGTQKLSVGQAENKLTHPDRAIRQGMFRQWEKTWQENENTFAQVLNNLSGFRLKTYEQRNWDSILKEPLFYNRMQEKTLDMMWEVISQSKAPLLAYLEKKAHMHHVEKLSWFDVDAPLTSATSSYIPFDTAANLIITQFDAFSPEMGQFAKHAFENRWIEAEDRPGKMPGGFCSQHPQSGQSRIFMTYSGTMHNVFTLAHELGHAYHNHATRHLPFFAQQYRMNVAETASTLAEMIVVDSVLQSNPQDRQALLDSKLQRAVTFLMNIHARFLFEKELYKERKQGFITAPHLNHMMEEAQKRAYQSALADWHPHFWVAKRHFYMTDVPFYNFPYTFGYLFSMGIYAKAQMMGQDFGKHYNALLQDTGRMSVEDLASKHLDVNLSEPYFWQAAMKLIEKDVVMFLKT
jgi:pepF/M3 family oligoendopeptidase